MIRRIIACALLALACASPALAQDGRWLRAESANFIVYGDRDERQVRGAIQALEDFDATLRIMTGAAGVQAAEAEAKLEVYLVRNLAGLRQIRPDAPETLGGFYYSGAEQIAAFLIYDDIGASSRREILFHEYAHHFMLHYFPQAYPRWYVEGFAEYVSTVEFRGRRAIVGAPSEGRAYWVGEGRMLPIEQLLAPETVRDTAQFRNEFYAHSWFAAMYVSNRSERLRGLQNYVAALGEGADSIEAFAPAFGITPEQFERELREFRRGRVAALSVQLPPDLARVSVTRMSRAANDLLLPLARVRAAGVHGEHAPALAAEIEQLATPHAADPLGQIALARAALLAEDHATARTRLEQILAADETHTEARYLLAELSLRDAVSYDAVVEVRRQLARGFRHDPNHFPTLYLYASTFIGQAGGMSEEQLNVLARALELAPQAEHIRITLAQELMRANMNDSALVTLRPLLHAPHGGGYSERARELFEDARARAGHAPR